MTKRSAATLAVAEGGVLHALRSARPNKTKLTGPPPPSIAKIDARAGGSG